MTPAEAVAALERLVEAGAKAHLWEHNQQCDAVDFLIRTKPCNCGLDAARPALSALAGMCVLDVETVRVLVGETTRRHINDPFHNIGDLVDCDSCAALAAAEAELRRVEVRDV